MGEAVWDRKAIMRGVHGETAIVLLGALEFAEARIAELERQILIQKNAARTIMHCEGDELRRLREQAREHHVAIQTLDSERAANARLTDELAAAQARLAEAVRSLKAVISIPAVRQILGSNHTSGCDCPLCGAAHFIQETERG